MIEGRKEPRVNVNWPIRIIVNKEIISGKVINISLSGIALECNKPLVLKSEIAITIMPPDCKPINVTGKVIWSESYALDMDNDNAALCIGMPFVNISTRDRYLLKEIIDISVESP